VNDSLADLIRLACQAEVLARKPGNVHPGASFDDLTAADFLASADAVRSHLATAGKIGVGRAVHDAVLATRGSVSSNTNLGICLLLAPCAAAAVVGGDFRLALQHVLHSLSVDDASWAYQAIRHAQPGGLGQADSQDVASEPTVTLLEAMQLAADRDGIARQYSTCFADVLEIGVPALVSHQADGPEIAIIASHLHLMAHRPDSLIFRKCGRAVADESADRALNVLKHGWPAAGAEDLASLDAWLRADGHRRNPGTTADLVAATIFVALQQRMFDLEAMRQWCEERVAGLSSD
jgi:triphosphoribosyl-dephospho-CoA synthase